MATTTTVPENTCCPSPGGQQLTYINTSGYFWNPTNNSYMALTSSGVPGYKVTDFYGKCTLTQSFPIAYIAPVTPVACTGCCPDHYHYADFTKWDPRLASTPCQSMFVPFVYIASVPCITCICPGPAVIPTCPAHSCESGGLPIYFTYNPFANDCACCKPIDNSVLPDDACLSKFIPYFLILPNANNFTLE